MTASEKQQRWGHMYGLAIYLVPLLALLILASSPLWYVREVMYPQTPEERAAYHSLWVRVPYALLCTAGAIASVLCLPMIGYILYGGMRSIWGLRTRGDAMATAAYVFLTVLMVSAILMLIMLPLYVTYQYHISSSDTTLQHPPTPATEAQSP